MRAAAFLGLSLVLAAPAFADGAGQLPALSAQWADAWSRHDMNAVMALYAPEAVFLPSRGPRAEGLGQIRARFEMVLPHTTSTLTLQSQHSEISGNLGYDSGTFDETVTPMEGGTTVLHFMGNYLFLYRCDADGGCKILEQTLTESVAMRP